MGLDDPFQSDVRGEIHRFDINGTKFNVLYTKKGAFRSGDIHTNTQYDRILKGKFKVTTLENKRDVVKIFSSEDDFTIPPNTPHLFEALEDTWMIEYWDGPFNVSYYEPYRKFVKEQFED